MKVVGTRVSTSEVMKNNLDENEVCIRSESSSNLVPCQGCQTRLR